MDDVTRLRNDGTGWYEGELPPAAVLEREFVALRERREALEAEPSLLRYSDHRLKVLQLQELLAKLDLDEEIRARAAADLEAELAWSDEIVEE